MRAVWQEFKSFAFKGNMIDLAVAVVIGTSFSAVVNSLVKNLIMPVISYIMPAKSGYLEWTLGRVQVGAFLGEVLNFLIIALAVFFIIVKLIGILLKQTSPPPPPAQPVNKECPFCLMTIPIKARKCGHCTADLPAIA